MTEARRDSYNGWIMGCPPFSRFCLWLVSHVTIVFMSQTFSTYLIAI
jgi:hypothetical protein